MTRALALTAVLTTEFAVAAVPSGRCHTNVHRWAGLSQLCR